jgi:hypothetical protein
MRNGFVLTRIFLFIAMLLTPNAWIWAQEAAPESVSSLGEQSVTVAGRVLGQASLKDAEALAVLLLPGWSEALAAELAAGRAPMILLDAGRTERIASASAAGPGRPTAPFEFPNVRPGEYQAVAVRIEKGAERGAIIAVGNRVVVADHDIKDIELEISALPSETAGQRQGGARNREAAVLDTVNRPISDTLTPPHIGPIGTAPSPPPLNGASRKKEVLEQILVGVGIVAAMVAFSLW